MQPKKLDGLRTPGSKSRRSPALRTRSRYLLIRRNLLDTLAQASATRCVVLSAPAGFGKSCLLATWQRELVLASIDVAWLNIESRASGKAPLIAALLASLEAVDPSLTRDAASLAERATDDEGVERVIIALVRAMSIHRREIVLIVDNADRLLVPAERLAIQLLVDFAPSNLRFSFATRRDLPISLARLHDSLPVMHLRLDDLRFSRDETLEYLEHLAPGIGFRVADGMHRLTDGWPALLQRAAADYRRRRGVPASSMNELADPAPFASFVRADVLAGFSETEMHLIACCAVPARFNAELCVELGGDRTPLATTRALVERLASDGLAAEQSVGTAGDRWWQMHPLVRSVLVSGVSTWPSLERRRIDAAAWPFFAARGMYHDAVRHALLAGDEAAAVELANQGAAALFARGDVRRLTALVRQLPRSLVGENPVLRLWMAWVDLCEHRLEDCERSVHRLHEELVQAEPAIRYRLTLLRCLLAIRLDDSDTVKAMQPELLEAPAEIEAIAQAGRRNVLSWLHIHLGEFARAREFQLDEPVTSADGEPIIGTLFGSLVGQCLVGMSLTMEGQMRRAETIYREVLREAERRGRQCSEAAHMAALLLVEILYEQEGPAVAARFVEERLVSHDTLIPDTSLRMMTVLNRSHQAAGRTREALACLALIKSLAQRFRMDRALAFALLDQLKIHLAQNDLDSARACLQALEEAGDRHLNAKAGTLRRVHAVVERGRIRMAMHEGQLQVALTKLEAVLADSARRGEQRYVVYFSLQAAEVERRLGRTEASRLRVLAALRLGHDLGLKQTLICSHDRALALISAAGAQSDLDPLLVFYVERIQALARAEGSRESTELGAPTLASSLGHDRLTPREQQIVELLMDAMPNKKIARALGLSLDTVKWHLKNIYLKLDAHGRDTVVAQMGMARQRSATR